MVKSHYYYPKGDELMRKQKAYLMTMRIAILSLALLVQFAVIIAMLIYFNDYFEFFYIFNIVIGVALAILIVNEDSNPAYKLAWVVPILALPLFGIVMYLFFSKNSFGSIEQRRRVEIKDTERKSIERGIELYSKNTMEYLRSTDPDAALQVQYLKKHAFAIPYRNTEVKYYPVGEVFLPDFLEDLKNAKKFIFLEYFIICEGKLWSSVLEILTQKVKDGVDVRIIYDDVGSIMKLPGGYEKQLQKLGIKCRVFSPAAPVLSPRLNNRDHRKIAVIDGNIAYTGGINLSDEYANIISRFGHWKDNAVRLYGTAAFSFTVMFASMWDFWNSDNMELEAFLPSIESEPGVTGVVQPYSDSPLDNEPVGENVYLNIINRAKKYVYIMTPYLIIGNEMLTSLKNAAKCGVDIRIITPSIPDKKFVHATTRSYYETLIESGVRIYEYSPGFLHSKTFVSDDSIATVGSFNLDFRSLYLHFECGTLLYDTPAISDIRADFEETFKICHEVTAAECKKVKLITKISRIILRTLAPLL